MTLCYDIDISYLYPPEVFDDPAKGALLRRNGLQPHSRANYVAKFRDQRTAQALCGAADEVRAFFRDCGFAFAPSGLTLPKGKLDHRFQNHLTDVADRMRENLAIYDLSEQDLNGLDIEACIRAITAAQPVTPPVREVAHRIGKGKSKVFLAFLLRPALALPALVLAMVLTLQFMTGTQRTVVSSNLIDANVTLLMPAAR